jgi:hypothetical protein
MLVYKSIVKKEISNILILILLFFEITINIKIINYDNFFVLYNPASDPNSKLIRLVIPFF